jgi:hypothetical protein
MSEYCREIQERIEEQVEKPVEKWVEKRRKKCKKKKCKKWCLCCNKWFCWIETFLERVVTWVVVTVTKWVTRVVCEVIDGLVSIAAVIVGLILAIPIIGRLIREIWSILIDIGWRFIGILGTLADIIGWEWRKRLRICIIILRDEKEVEVATEASLAPHIDAAEKIYDQAANVTLIVEGIHTITGSAPKGVLDVGCGASAWGDDLWLPGGWFEVTANDECFEGNARRLLGWASPIVVFVVRDVEGKLGCSLGPFSDYVTVKGSDASCLAHELGHACALWHVSGRDNLMNAACRGTKLKKWQRVILRGSRHVTYF